ncbi:hypothetical protein MSPP1_003461 [Malassezia sp. CBS 17886]|nr:hypothetical protein MSPP1_003461 [Malassezia sp. CBS 17886]
MIHGPNSPDAPTAAQVAAATEHAAPYTSYPMYGKAPVYIMSGVVLIAFLFHVFNLVRRARPQTGNIVEKIPLLPRVIAAFRIVAYTPWKPLCLFGFPTVGIFAMVLIYFASLLGWCFAIRPYYRPSFEWGASPLSLRAGILCIAQFPFFFACALKVSPVALLTGFSHAKLQVFHQWLAGIAFFFAWVHAIPMLLQPYWDGGKSNLKAWWDYEEIYWTGTAAICLFTWIAASSLGFFRNWAYEFFVLQHIITVLAFIIVLFKHVQNIANGNIYLWSASALWMYSVTARILFTLFSTAMFTRAAADVEVASIDGVPPSEKTIRVTLSTPLRWRPGQHVFLRLPTMAPIQAHPFSILSIPGKSRYNDLVLLVRVRDGVTHRLWSKAFKSLTASEQATETDSAGKTVASENASEQGTVAAKPGSDLEKTSSVHSPFHTHRVSAIFDGPYGFVTNPAGYAYATFVSGGTGIAHAFPLALQLLRDAAESKPVVTQQIHFVWAVRGRGTLQWMRSNLDELVYLAEKTSIGLTVDVYVTGEQDREESQALFGAGARHVNGRPNLKTILDENMKDAMARSMGNACVHVCGPAPMSYDVAVECAKLNWSVFRGKLGSLREVALENESFTM